MMESKTFYLVRHGLATHSTRGYGRRKQTAPLLPEGRPAILRLAQTLTDISDSFHISSEISRAKETSEIITDVTGKHFLFDKRLNEGNHETIGQIRERVQSFLKYIETLPQKNIIICTHGVIIAAIKNLLVHEKFVTKQLTDYPATGELMIIEEKKARVTTFN